MYSFFIADDLILKEALQKNFSFIDTHFDKKINRESWMQYDLDAIKLRIMNLTPKARIDF